MPEPFCPSLVGYEVLTLGAGVGFGSVTMTVVVGRSVGVVKAVVRLALIVVWGRETDVEVVFRVIWTVVGESRAVLTSLGSGGESMTVPSMLTV